MEPVRQKDQPNNFFQANTARNKNMCLSRIFGRAFLSGICAKVEGTLGSLGFVVSESAQLYNELKKC